MPCVGFTACFFCYALTNRIFLLFFLSFPFPFFVIRNSLWYTQILVVGKVDCNQFTVNILDGVWERLNGATLELGNGFFFRCDEGRWMVLQGPTWPITRPHGACESQDSLGCRDCGQKHVHLGWWHGWVGTYWHGLWPWNCHSYPRQ